jgi:hypothetical protein
MQQGSSMKSNSSKTRAGNDLFKSSTGKSAKAPKAAVAAPAVLVGAHGRYQVKSGRLGGEYVARAFPKPPTKSRGLVAEATGATEEAAIAALHEMIDARESRRSDERRTDAHTGTVVPSVEEFAEAIAQVDLSKPQKAMLTALTLAGDDGMTETRMSRVAGYKSRASTSRSFAGAGLMIADFLSIAPQEATAAGEPEGTALLGYRGTPAGEDEPGAWIIHEELREAVRNSIG